MARRNWEELKKEFMLGDYKSLKEFADKKGINYDYLRRKTKGWLKERVTKQSQKSHKIIEKTIEKQIEHEVDYNTTHLKLWGEFLNILSEALKDIENIKTRDGKISAAALEKLANVMDKAQKGQRLALGLDEQKQDNTELLNKVNEIVRALQDDNV
ncbi:MAG: hypothetical protein JG776_462 [Caloramator sp.]|uniref:hypothetical protein n=1 Tax=unclassified Caloramator TaxID=2629145 RepID=UPI0003F9F9D2|nr:MULTISPECIES: hypothetical protein [unclassified Caloramator]MBZ4662780.1 hypothetical protein [Caloramator sp.]